MSRCPLYRLLWGLCLGSAVAIGMAHAQAPADPGAERERIALERAAVQALFAEREAACQTRFAVTDCVNDAKAQRREALAPLRRQVDALDDAQRKQRAARRLEDARNKESDAQAREREVVVREAPAKTGKLQAVQTADAASAPVRVVKQKPTPRRTTARAPPPVPSLAERGAKEEAGQARIEARKQAAQAHREAAEQRNAERAASGRRPAPLPVPASAALP